MTEKTDLYNSTYGKFNERVLEEIRVEAFGKDIGQNSWITADEMLALTQWLNLNSNSSVLEVACGSGGPALFVAETTGCNICGVDANNHGIETARSLANTRNLASRARFEVADANQTMPFEQQSFDALICMDAVNHLFNRPYVLNQWYQLLKPGGRFLYTDPIIVTGPLSNEEIAIRSSVGFFLFVPASANEKWIEEAGFQLLHRENVTPAAAMVAKRWFDARWRRKEELELLEGHDRFAGLQSFLDVAYRLFQEQRLSRFAYVGEKP